MSGEARSVIWHKMSYTEGLHWMMLYWQQYDAYRKINALGRIDSILILRPGVGEVELGVIV